MSEYTTIGIHPNRLSNGCEPFDITITSLEPPKSRPFATLGIATSGTNLCLFFDNLQDIAALRDQIDEALKGFEDAENSDAGYCAACDICQTHLTIREPGTHRSTDYIYGVCHSCAQKAIGKAVDEAQTVLEAEL